MSQVIEFLTPRMVGPRFAEHAIPLELLKDLAVLEEMIIEVAKWCYLQDHPERKRSPKGFTDGVALKLSGVGEGSAVPQLSLVVEQTQLFPPQAQTYYEQARTHLIGAINAAEYDESITQHLPDALLAYFDRFGRGLRDGEAIEFAPQAADRKARLTKATRRKLVLASSQVQELTEEVTLRGSVPEADQGKMTFELQVINGPRVVAPIAGQHLPTVMDAFNGYKQGARVLLQGIGRYNRYDRLQSLETVEHLSLLDIHDIAARLEELKTLRHGWLDGKKGFAPDKAGLDWLAEAFQRNSPDELAPPYLYPTAEGGVQAEWSVNGWEISLEIDLDRHQGQWHALDMANEQEQEKTLDLNEPADWQWLATEITQRPSSQAFRPTPKDEQKLSVYDGDQITPADAFEHYTKDLKLGSSGVLAVSMADCGALELPVTPDPGPFPEHALIDFSAYGKSATEKKAKLLKAKAEARGWLYREVMA